MLIIGEANNIIIVNFILIIRPNWWRGWS